MQRKKEKNKTKQVWKYDGEKLLEEGKQNNGLKSVVPFPGIQISYLR